MELFIILTMGVSINSLVGACALALTVAAVSGKDCKGLSHNSFLDYVHNRSSVHFQIASTLLTVGIIFLLRAFKIKIGSFHDMETP